MSFVDTASALFSNLFSNLHLACTIACCSPLHSHSSLTALSKWPPAHVKEEWVDESCNNHYLWLTKPIITTIENARDIERDSPIFTPCTKIILHYTVLYWSYIQHHSACGHGHAASGRPWGQHPFCCKQQWHHLFTWMELVVVPSIVHIPCINIPGYKVHQAQFYTLAKMPTL